MSEIPSNPYRYQSEIKTEEYFIGREDQLDEVEYLLSLTEGERPVYQNFSVTGPSGVGKSSFTYQIENIAERSGMSTIRLNLNNTNKFTIGELIEKIYFNIVSKSNDGRIESVKESFKSITDEFEVNAEVFRYVASPSKRSNDIDSIPKDRIIETLEKIYNEKFSDKNGILITIDNISNVESVDVIKNLHDIFSNISGYSLVISGDINKISQNNESNSFNGDNTRVINLSKFSSIDKTKSIIKTPLTSSVADDLPDGTIHEIHQLSDGNPYEINLLAFYMYYHYENNELDSLVLDPEVIDRAAKEISKTTSFGKNNILRKIKDLDQVSLKILIPLVEAPSIPEDWLIQYSSFLFFDSTTVSQLPDLQDTIRQKILELKNKNIIRTTDDNYLELNSNLYTSVFIKYHTLARDLVDNFSVIGNHLESNTENIKNSILSNIHYRLVDSTLLDNFEAHSHYKILDTTGVKRSYSEQLVDTANIEVSTHSDGPILPDRITVVDDHDEFYTDTHILPISRTDDSDTSESGYSEDQTLRFRCSVSWLDTSYTVIIHAEDENEIPKIKRYIRSREEQLDIFGISIEYETSKEYVKKGLNEFNESNYSEATNKFDKALEINPNNYDAMFYSSYSNYHQSEFESALNDINNTIRMNNNWTDAQYLKGLIHFERSEYQKAADALEKAAKLCPDNTDLREHLCCLLDRDLPSSAIKYGEAAIRQGVDNYHVHYHLSIAYIRDEEYEDAIRVANEIIANSSDPTQVSRTKLMKASAVEECDRTDDAVEIYDDIIENSHDSYSIQSAYYERGICMVDSDPEQAINDLNEYLDRTSKTGTDTDASSDLYLYNPGGGSESKTANGDPDKALYYRGISKMDLGEDGEGLTDLREAASNNEEIISWIQDLDLPELNDSVPAVRNLQDKE